MSVALMSLIGASYLIIGAIECINHFKETHEIDVLGSLFWVVCHELEEVS